MDYKKGKKIQINISNRGIYFVVTLAIIIALSVGVFALTAGTTPNPGHLISEMGVLSNCGNNSALMWNGSNLVCGNSFIWEYRDSAIGGYISTAGESTKSVHQKIISIGDWNMDSSSGVYLLYGGGGNIDWDDITSVSVLIKSDTNAMNRQAINLERGGSWTASPVADNWIVLTRTEGGVFDNTNFDATSYNRGWVTITYLV